MSWADRRDAALLTAGGAGLLRPAPGTWGSLVGVALHAGTSALLGGAEWGAPLLALVFFLATAWTGDAAERIFERKDPPSVVSDEVAGVLVALAFTAWSPVGFWPRAIAAFILFRVFDIWKPWPVRRLERLPGGLGIAADDVAAGILANAALQAGLLAHGRLLTQGWAE
jgi:phosphatidylglycerophosphatase A